MLKGFRDFILRGNVVDMAVGIVIGVAFGGLVSAFTKAFIEPLIKLLAGGGVEAGTFKINDVVFDYTLFINAVITFLATAAVIYFFVVVPMNKFKERLFGPADEAAASELDLLTEIRDELRARR